MNNIIITHELCAEDRARLDRLAEALERRACDKCVSTTLEVLGQKQPAAADPIQEKLAETLAKAEAHAEAPKNAPDEAKAETLTTEPQKEEEPAAKEDAPKEEPTVTLDMIQQKVVQLAAHNGGAKKAQVRAIINAHGARVSDLKEKPEAWTTVWEQLTALEAGE